MDPRINSTDVIPSEKPPVLLKYWGVFRGGFKRAMSYELFAFLSMGLLLKMIVKNEGSWSLKIKHIIFYILGYY